MKIVAFCASARKNGNTAMLLNTVLEPLKEAGAETELVELAGSNIKGCKACLVCFRKKMERVPLRMMQLTTVSQKCGKQMP